MSGLDDPCGNPVARVRLLRRARERRGDLRVFRSRVRLVVVEVLQPGLSRILGG